MASFITHVIFAGGGYLILGPLGAVVGFVLALVINSKAKDIEAQWQRDDADQ